MFDEVFEMFERDGRRGRPAGERRGLRGLISRVFGDGDDHDDVRRARYENDHDDHHRRSRYDDDGEYDGHPNRRRRERDNDLFDFGD